jgi:hypothetical protein
MIHKRDCQDRISNLFLGCFEYVLAEQRSDRSRKRYGFFFDGVSNFLGTLLALVTYRRLMAKRTD